MESNFGLWVVNRKLLEISTHWFRFGACLAWFIWWYINLNILWYMLTIVALWVYDIVFWRFEIWCHYILSLYLSFVSWWYAYQCLVWICMMNCWVYKLCNVVSYLYLQVAFMAWIWVIFAHWSFIIDEYSDWRLGFGLSMP